jgi:hypothetical protein
MSTLKTYNIDSGDVTNLTVKTNGTAALTINGSTQNVGIGTVTPTEKLDVSGNLRLGASAYLKIGTGFSSYIQGTTNTLTFGTNSIDRVTIDSSGNLLFNSGYGYAATAYGCRAWVNFNGTGTVAIRGSGNVTSITDNGVGDYTVNFTTAMPDANYSGQVCIGTLGASDGVGGGYTAATLIAASFRIRTLNASQSTAKDFDAVYVTIHR